jgi:hypothetical protein
MKNESNLGLYIKENEIEESVIGLRLYRFMYDIDTRC